MKKLCLIILFYTLTILCFAHPRVTIYQRCGQKDLTFFYKDGPGFEGVKVNDSTTTFEAPVDQPCELAIIVGEDNRHLKRLWVLPGNAERKATIDHCTGQFFRQDTLPIDIDSAPIDGLEMAMEQGRITGDSFLRGFKYLEEQYIILHPDSFLAVHYLNSLKDNISTEKLHEYVARVGICNAHYPDMQDILTYQKNYQYKGNPNPGDPFFEFQAKSADGKIFDSKSIKGKVIVLYFCFSGCGPCGRAAGPLREVYEKYRPSGMEVISFSLDKTEEDWQKSMTTHHYPGINVSDLVGFSSQLFLHYAVNAFPFFVVFDRDKKIAMVTSGEDEVSLVETKVRELIAKK